MLRAKFGLTKEKISKLQPELKAYAVADTNTKNLWIAVYPTGVKTYLLCKRIDGKWKRLKISRVEDLTIEQARKEASRLNALIALGADPQLEKQEKRKALTFKELYEYYYEQHALHFTKRPKANKRTVELNIFPLIGNKKAIEVSPDNLRRIHFRIAENSSPANANRVLALVSAAYNFCIKNSFFNGGNPCSSVKKFRTVSRDRFLNYHELQSFFDAVSKEDTLFEHFFLMLLYTGARKSNVLSMKWSDINFDLKQWRISEQETKNSDVNIVYLSEQAMLILQMRIIDNNNSINKSVYVFPGKSKMGHLIDPKKSFTRIKERMKINDFRMHDLRRTLGSYMAIGGASLPVIGKALNHKSQASTAIYARLSQAPVLDAINTAVELIRLKREYLF